MDKDTADWLIEQHRESYRYQLEQRDKIYDRISFLSPPLTLLGAGIIYVIANRPQTWTNTTPIWFWVFIVAAICLFGAALATIIYVIVRGFRYGYAITPRELQDYAVKLSKYLSQKQTDPKEVLPKIKISLGEQYCEAATHNSGINYERRNLILTATKISAVAFICFTLSLPGYFFAKLDDKEKPTKVMVVEPVKISR